MTVAAPIDLAELDSAGTRSGPATRTRWTTPNIALRAWHGDEWAESVELDVESLNDEWTEAINALVNVHAQRSRALAVRAMAVGGEQPTVGTLGFRPSEI